MKIKCGWCGQTIRRFPSQIKRHQGHNFCCTECRTNHQYWRKRRFLLIMGCSKTKNKTIHPISAFDRYTGYFYKILKKIKRENQLPPNLEILIISAEYGLLQSTDIISDYERKMNKKRAIELQESVTSKLKIFVNNKTYYETFINLAKNYMPTIDGCEKIIKSDYFVTNKGTIGIKGHGFKTWLLSIINPGLTK